MSHLSLQANVHSVQYIRPHFFFFNHPATPEIYTLSLHDALPISSERLFAAPSHPYTRALLSAIPVPDPKREKRRILRSEEHTSELQSQSNLVCRLLLEKKNRWGARSSGGYRCSRPSAGGTR